MAAPSPVRQRLLDLGAPLAVYGPPERRIELAEIVGDEIDLEYAAIRKGCVLIDRPDRGIIRVTGPDRLPFLNNMLTQELKDIAPLEMRPSFWLNRKGRIDADLRVVALEDEILFDLDAHAVERVVASLASYLIMEDAQIADASQDHHRFSLHGPTAPTLLEALGVVSQGPAPSKLDPARACRMTLDGADALVVRDDETGETGFELFTRAADAPALWDRLMTARFDSEQAQAGTLAPLPAKVRLRPAGWHAFNVARIEAGRPMFNLDFGSDALPAETGLLDQRVNFKKGCYLGQEVVARMASLGHPKQILVALRLEGDAAREADGQPRQPVTGAAVFTPDDADKPVGAVTSSAVSPMLGAASVCFAVVKWGRHEPGTALRVEAEGLLVDAKVQPRLRFLPDSA